MLTKLTYIPNKDWLFLERLAKELPKLFKKAMPTFGREIAHTTNNCSVSLYVSLLSCLSYLEIQV